jgi:hypothetical protein
MKGHWGYMTESKRVDLHRCAGRSRVSIVEGSILVESLHFDRARPNNTVRLVPSRQFQGGVSTYQTLEDALSGSRAARLNLPKVVLGNLIELQPP